MSGSGLIWEPKSSVGNNSSNCRRASGIELSGYKNWGPGGA